MRRRHRSDTLTDGEVPDALDLLTAPDADEEVRRGIVLMLQGRYEPEVVEALVERLDRDGEASVRRLAAMTLGRNREPRAASALVAAAADDDDVWVRARAVEALGRLQASDGVPAMIALSTNEDWRVRYLAVVALGRVMDQRSIGALADRLDERLVIAHLAAAYLGAFACEEATAAFTSAPRSLAARWSFRHS